MFASKDLPYVTIDTIDFSILLVVYGYLFFWNLGLGLRFFTAPYLELEAQLLVYYKVLRFYLSKKANSLGSFEDGRWKVQVFIFLLA